MKEDKCSRCGHVQDYNLKYCQQCSELMEEEYIPEEHQIYFFTGIKGYIQRHPFWSTAYFELVFTLLIGQIPNYQNLNPFAIFIPWMIILGLFCAYVAWLRGRSPFYGLLLGLGVIILAVLPNNMTKGHFKSITKNKS